MGLTGSCKKDLNKKPDWLKDQVTSLTRRSGLSLITMIQTSFQKLV